jgi:hypothetical protein
MKDSRVAMARGKEGVLYTALFVDDINALKGKYPPVHPNEYYHHSTIAFKPEDGKEGIHLGEKQVIAVTGRVTSDKVDVLLVKNEKSVNAYPHITLSTAEGVKPFESNDEIDKAVENGTVITVQDSIPVTEGYFDGESDVTSMMNPGRNDRYHTIVVPTRLQTDTIIAIFLLKFFGKDMFPGVETAQVSIDNHVEGSESELMEKGFILLDMGHGRFDHHSSGETATYLVAKELNLFEDKALEKMIQLADRDDKEGKGTISTDSLDRAFGLPGLIMAMNKSLPEEPNKIWAYMMPILWAHYSEEWRRHYGIPQEFEAIKEKGGVKEFETRHKGKKITGMYVESDNQSIAGWMRSKMGPYADVVIIRNSKGYVSILTKQIKRIDLRMVAFLLRQKELAKSGIEESDWHTLSQTARIDMVPEWYYDTATNSLLNGSLTSDSIPQTKLDTDALIDAIVQGLSEFPKKQQ